MIDTNTEQVLVNLSPGVVGELSRFNVGPVEFQRVSVEFSVNTEILRQYAEALVDNLQNSDTSIASVIDTELMVKYLNTLLKLRIDTVNRSKDRYAYLDACPMPTVPAFFSVYLENVGQARDTTIGVDLFPIFKGSSDDVLDVASFQRVSNSLARFGRAGFEFTTRLPRDVKGSWELMSMQALNDEIRNHDGKAHLVYALLASLVGQTITETVLLPRVSYGQTGRFAGLVKEFARFKS